MSTIKFKYECEIHKKVVYTVCLNKECSNRYLCVNCFKEHEQSHSKNYVPICELLDAQNNIIIFDDYMMAHKEENNKLLLKKKKLIAEVNVRIEELKNGLEQKINEIFDEWSNPLLHKNIKNVNNLSLDEISSIYETINDNNHDKSNDIDITTKSFGVFLKSQFDDVIDNFSNFQSKFKFKFRKGLNYSINNNGTLATKIGNSNIWNCSIFGDREIPKNKISKWKIKLNNFEIKSNTWNVLIGIGPENVNNETNFQNKCWSFICGNSLLRDKGENKNCIEYFNHSGKLKKNDVVEVTVDRIKGHLSFAVNDVDYGIAFTNIPSKETLYPVVLIYDVNQTVELLN